MDNEFITRQEHEEFSRRLEDWDKRQDRRIEILEQNVKATEKLATNMEGMLKEQERQGDKLAELESRDGKMWRKVVEYVVTVVVGIVVGYVFGLIGM